MQRHNAFHASRTELEEQPWLDAFIEDGDTSLEPARERYHKAMAQARAALRAAGATLYRRMRTANGHETTALQTHSAKDAP